ncbi:uncharacterized protein LOC121836568 [Ixodes scapularis]|uniref:uncharacterized protein LOC121836568 n=1 Tax=Ixodes scapularis TaxID=6945 RepID=UPI001C38838F|nr:uncharacterized protein LOC121836568 [Ixodes scapularis]
MEHASKYTAVKELRYGEKFYNITAYAALPEDTVKGIDCTKVSYYVYYHGAEYRCFIHKKRHEVCDGRGRLGHRTDVCPAPEKKICKICGTKVPSENHHCEPKCALCGRDHPTGDKKCRPLFQTPYLLKKRKWEKQQIQNNRRRPQKGLGNPASTPSILKKNEPAETRQARAKALYKLYEKSEDVVYVDAADYASRDAMAFVVVNRQRNSIASGSLRTSETEAGEETAIALAMTASTKIKYVVSDSKSAILDYARGRISPEASAIVKSGFRNDARTGKIYLIWAPAHSDLAGNECTHDAARGFTDRADIDPNTTFAHSLRCSGKDRLVSYRDITNHYRMGQGRFPPAHSSQNKRQSVVWRLLQTNSHLNPVTYSYCYSGQYSYKSHKCKERADLAHTLWACPQAVAPGRRITQVEQWETVLLSSDPADQNWAIQLAEDAARAQGLLADA